VSVELSLKEHNKSTHDEGKEQNTGAKGSSLERGESVGEQLDFEGRGSHLWKPEAKVGRGARRKWEKKTKKKDLAEGTCVEEGMGNTLKKGSR